MEMGRDWKDDWESQLRSQPNLVNISTSTCNASLSRTLDEGSSISHSGCESQVL